MRPVAVRSSRVSHFFGRGDTRKQILFDCDLTVNEGEVVVMTGPSGSGKSTLLTLIGGLRSVQEGSLSVLGHEMNGLAAGGLVMARRNIGFIFQAHNLFESLSARENVMMALDLTDLGYRERRKRADEMLTRLGLAERLTYRPPALSGGQRQRVAIARALAPRPRLVLADEPTAALDAASGREVLNVFQEMSAAGCTVFMVTHDKRVLDAADRVVHMLDGKIASDVQTKLSVALGEFLAQVPAFAGLSPTVLSEVTQQLRRVEVAPDQVVVRQHDPGDSFYLVHQGEVRVTVSKGGAEQELARLGPGQFFGEAALLTGEPRNASVIAAGPTVLYSLDKEQFDAAIAKCGDLHKQLLEVLFLRQ
ncbi:MAG: ATP-binding cassette domain-containing protein [Planctomycetota bacterium]